MDVALTVVFYTSVVGGLLMWIAATPSGSTDRSMALPRCRDPVGCRWDARHLLHRHVLFRAGGPVSRLCCTGQPAPLGSGLLEPPGRHRHDPR